MALQRTHVLLPEELIDRIDRTVGKRRRSAFLADAASREMRRVEQLEALDAAAGSWKDEDHPELKDGAAAWVRRMRLADETARADR